MRIPKILVCSTLFIGVNACANDGSPIDMAEMLDDSTLAMEVIRDWHLVDGACPTRQKHITIRVAQLWEGQEYRIPVRMVVPADRKAKGFHLTGGHGLKDMTRDGDAWTAVIELKEGVSHIDFYSNHGKTLKYKGRQYRTYISSPYTRVAIE